MVLEHSLQDDKVGLRYPFSGRVQDVRQRLPVLVIRKRIDELRLRIITRRDCSEPRTEASHTLAVRLLGDPRSTVWAPPPSKTVSTVLRGLVPINTKEDRAYDVELREEDVYQ